MRYPKSPAESLNELKAAFNQARLIQFAKAEGLAVRGSRIQCPAGCGNNDPRRASTGEQNGIGVWHCKSCEAGGSVVDLIMTRGGADMKEIAEKLQGFLGRTPEPPPPVEQHPQVDGAALWENLPTYDRKGQEYLESRGLGDAARMHLVRFCNGTSGYWWLDRKAREGYRLAVPLRSVAGDIVTFQIRACHPAKDSRFAKLSLKGSPSGNTVFGEPLVAQTAPRVYLTEGIADTLAVQLCGVPAVGAPGVDQVPSLIRFIGNPAGREFVLCPQNDAQKHGKSESRFAELAEALKTAGGIVITLKTPDGYEDPAAWLQGVGTAEFSKAILTAGGLPPMPEDKSAAAPMLRSVSTGAAPTIPITTSYASIVQILRRAELRKRVLGDGKLEFNEQILMPCLNRQPIYEEHVGRIRELCELEFKLPNGKGVEFAREKIEQAILQVSKENSFHPVAEYLKARQWDGQQRIDQVAEQILGVDATMQPLAPRLIRLWMISAVARALRPGCKVDTVLVLAGPQGARKSEFFRVLASPAFFSDTPVQISNKDGLIGLRSAWIHEWAELETIARARDSRAVKAFITSAVDNFRPPYERANRMVPRTNVFVGSTNDDDFLDDATGNRRFWPIQVRRRIDDELASRWRDQLWAEAVHAFRAGEKWWITDLEEAKQLAEVHRSFEAADPWTEIVLEFAESQVGPFPISEVLRRAIGKDTEKWTKRDEARIADILKANDYVKTDKRGPREGPKKTRRWLWWRKEGHA